jgi:hypothetical protein
MNTTSGISMDSDCCDPVSLWLKTRTEHAWGAWHSAGFVFDGIPVSLRSNSADVIAYLRSQIAVYYPDEASVMGRRSGFCIEIHVIDGARDRRVILPVGNGVPMKQALDLPAPQAMTTSREFVHMRWNEIESFWRPFDLLVSFKLSPPAHVRLLIARPALPDEPATRAGPFQAKAGNVHGHAEPRPRNNQPGRRDLPLEEIADLVKTMTVRTRGHLFLHAATVASGQRGILLLGSGGSGKTTTALALLRGGYELRSDDHSVLSTDENGVHVAGFRSTPRIVGPAPATLAELERTLESPGGGKAPFEVRQAPAPSGSGPWLRPAALFFLRIRSGSSDHFVRPLAIEEAFVRVTNQVLDPTNVFRQVEQAQAIIRLVEVCPAYELVLGNNLASLPELVRGAMESTG